MAIKDHPSYKEEVNRLEYTINYVKKTLDATKEYKSLYKSNFKEAMEDLEQVDSSLSYINMLVNTQFMEMIERNYYNLVKAKEKPYFARIDFKMNGNKHTDKLYIGKTSLLRVEDNEPLIVDWRAPVSNLYYEGRLGKESYNSETETIEGELLLKRQFTIEKGELKNIFDIDITTTDEFLQASLEANADNRLKDIASTIQSEQNRIIRADMTNPLIVQGVAGSGKTTIALHRIAYFIYTFERTFEPENFMIMAPNRLFMDYISEVLPELGVERVKQTTYTDFIEELIGKKYRLVNTNEKLIYLMKANISDDNLKLIKWVTDFKCSLDFKKLLDNYIKDIEESFPPDEDFIVYMRPLLDAEIINRMFFEELNYLSFHERIKEIKKSLKNKVKYNKDDILKGIENFYDKKIDALRQSMEESEEKRQKILHFIDKRDTSLESFKQECKTAVDNYAQKFPAAQLFDYYIELMTNEENILKYSEGNLSKEQISFLCSYSKDLLLNKRIEIEDYAPLAYLKHKIFGFHKKIKVKSIVIDEAQDFSLMQLYVLKDILNTNMFTLLGDLSQGIHSYRGLKDWRDVLNDVFSNTRASYMTLVQSYRTTIEVMSLANEVIKRLQNEGIILAKPVIRHGEKPEYKIFTEPNILASSLENKVIEMKEAGYKSIAIICKSFEECKTLKKLLNRNKEIDAQIIDEKSDIYRAGVVLVPSFMSKGLEFDVVFIVNLNEKYSSTELDIKLLYVAMTRTLHRLFIYSLEGCMETLEGISDEFYSS